MGSNDRSDDRSFQTNFTAEGIAVLKEKLNEKLKELTGDTDEILVDYVIVLLKNGKGKNQAKNDLNLILGDDSDSFVSWLWDHLALNIDLYVQPKGLQDEAPKSKVVSKVQVGDDDFKSLNQKSESVKSRSRRNKDWNGLVGRDAEAPPLPSFVVDNMHLDKKDQSKVNRGPTAPSLTPPIQRKKGCAVEQQKTRKRGCAEQQKTMKRGCAVEQQKTKRDSVSQVTIDAPRRLLQFAVRDAVAASRPSNLGRPVEPSLKRLRAAVSSSNVESSMVEQPHRMQTISNLVKFKSSGSAFDPIDCDMYPSYGNVQLEDNQYQEESPYDNVQLEDNQYQEESPFLYHEKNDYDDQYAANMTMLDHETGFQFEDNQYQEESPFLYHEKNDYGDQYAANMTALDHETGFQFEDNQYEEESPFLYHEKNDFGDQYAANMTMLDHETGVPSDSSSDNEGFDDVNFMGNRVGRVSQFSSSGGKRGEDSLMGNYSATKNDDSMLLKKNRNQDQSAAAPNSSKIVNISVNVNAWNPPVPKQYAKPRKVAELSGHKTLNSGTRAPKSGLSMVNENAKTAKIDSGKAKPTLDLLKVTQKAQPSTPGTGSSAASCPLDDADSRTIFASNVHFAATKDAICRHFNKFGEVLKAVIVTDSITGKPKGAAYVEFMYKEAADNALSLDGTSFMSRILKVVRKSTAQQEDAPAVPWPNGVRGSPYPSAKFLKAPIPTGTAGAYRPRPPVKFGARSLQWKRDAQGTSSDNGATLNNSSISAPVSRGLTYVRPESKLDGSLSTMQFNSSKNGRRL